MIHSIKGKQPLHQTLNRRVYIMNVIEKFAAVVALGLVSFSSFVAQDMGTVQVSGAEMLSAFEAQVAAKAEAAGASSYKIVPVAGNDQLRGTAILYK
ncbi:MAG: YdgH/BhsA/McbA-like domain containing protein [Symbiopectobacterium sp.]|uniref:YdgH/BhsA/McbA-like domain containing protein n=1 Tax=Symbiopectobacterium sp. TaxID=2952789 RepID=UPI003F32993B